MRWSQTYIPTLRENQSDAELVSHQLLLRGGYIRKLASGVYIYLPLMQRVIEKFSNIVREEMNAAGALEITMSVLCPVEVWQKTGRYDTVGKELMTMKDRHDHEMILCGTHEETVTNLVAGEVKSYKQLPMNLYQIQVKFRDEIRPRFGLMRGREFVMKDAYTFDATVESQKVSYQKMVDAYFRIFKRAGLEVLKVDSDSGAMGGSNAHEFMFMVDTNAGEETILYCTDCLYAANEEKAIFRDTNKPDIDAVRIDIETVDTPGAATIEEVSEFLKVKTNQLVKTLIYMADEKPVAALVRGDRTVNETKLKNAVSCVELEPANAEQVEKYTKAPVGFAGPVGLTGVRKIVDPLVAEMKNFIVGANENEKHFIDVNIDRDFKASSVFDISTTAKGDGCPKCDSTLDAKSGIEVGNTFMLGTKYSKSLGAKFLDADGKEQLMIMGSYGIGITRTPQAALEKYSDEGGIVWPVGLAPYLVEIIPLNVKDEEIVAASEKIYAEFQDADIDVLLDDRSERAGVKFNDADLIGIPVRITIGAKSLKDGLVEVKLRSSDDIEKIELAAIVQHVKKVVQTLK